MPEYTCTYSILIPTHGRIKDLEEVIRALEDQRNTPSFEIIVVADGDPRVQPWLQQRGSKRPLTVDSQLHAGPAVARNRAIDLARGEYIAFLGDDTVPAPDWLSQHHSRRQQFPDNVTVVGRTRWHPRITETPFLRFINEYGLQFGYSIIDDPDELSFCYFYTSNITIPRATIGETRFSERFPFAAMEDIELGYRLQRSGMRIVYEPSAVVAHSHQISVRSFLERQRRVGASAAVFAELQPQLADFLGVPPHGLPFAPSATAAFDLERTAELLQHENLHLPDLWQLICRRAYLRGLREGLMAAGVEDASDLPWMRQQQITWMAQEQAAMARTIRVLAEERSGRAQAWIDPEGGPLAQVPAIPPSVRPRYSNPDPNDTSGSSNR